MPVSSPFERASVPSHAASTEPQPGIEQPRTASERDSLTSSFVVGSLTIPPGPQPMLEATVAREMIAAHGALVLAMPTMLSPSRERRNWALVLPGKCEAHIPRLNRHSAHARRDAAPAALRDHSPRCSPLSSGSARA